MKAPHIVYFVQSDERRFQKGVYSDLAHITYRTSAHYLTEAKWIREFLSNEFGHDAKYAPNAINDGIFFPTSPIAPKTDRLRILLEGPISIDYKRMNDAFLAVRDLDAEIWCVVSDFIPDDWRRADRFFLKVPHTQMPEIYSSCDVLVKLSAVEGFFGPPLEMMACGGTAVVTRVTGFDEYIKDGENALTVDIGDYSGARAHLLRLIEDRHLLKLLKKNALETAAQFRWEPTIDIVERYFQEIVHRAPTTRLDQEQNSPELSVAGHAYGMIYHGAPLPDHARRARQAFYPAEGNVCALQQQVLVVRGWACGLESRPTRLQRKLWRVAANPVEFSDLNLSVNGAAATERFSQDHLDRADVARALNISDAAGKRLGFKLSCLYGGSTINSVEVSTTAHTNFESNIDSVQVFFGFQIEKPKEQCIDYEYLIISAETAIDEWAYIREPLSRKILHIHMPVSRSGQNYVARLQHSSLTDYRFTDMPVEVYLPIAPKAVQWVRPRLLAP